MIEFAYTLAVILMIVIPVALAAGLRRVANPAWLLFGLGALTFFFSQVVHLPLNNWLTDLGWLPSGPDTEVPLWRTALILGLTAGLSEELLRAAGYFFLAKVRPAWLRVQDGLMLGLGHGGFESMVVGGVLTAAAVSSILPLMDTDLTALNLQPEQLSMLQLQMELFRNPLNAVLPLLERLIAISAHVGFSLLVWKAFAARRLGRDWYYILIAIAYHTAVDMVAVFGAGTFGETPLIGFLVFAASLLPLWAWVIWQVRKNWEPLPEENRQKVGALDPSLVSEMGVFWIAIMKEMRQLWRTRRLLVMGAVFLLFGMGSPLLAYFTPQMFTMIEGAEMFSELIPDPTAGDAMTQYIKNLSQFGFILAVVLAMGAVVGEKERGVAPMILSKPMPRWAFIASKFTAQFIMYAAGFLLSGLGACYYTLFLFGGLEFGAFMLLNGLLLLWLLTFVALSLLGSTLAGSTVAAGGIGLGLSVLLILLANIPRYGILLPGGLMSWATLLGIQAAGAQASMPGMDTSSLVANGGAAASALVVIVMALVLSVGVFEQQEL